MLDRIAELLGRFSLKKMFFLCMFFFILIPFAAITIVSNFYAGNLISEKAHENSLQALIQTQNNISGFLSEVEGVSLEVISDYSLQNYIKEYYLNTHDDAENFSERDKAIIEGERLKYEVMETFRKIFATKPRIRSLFISDAGQTIFRFGETEYNESTPYHRQALQLAGRAVWTSPYLEFNQNALRDRLVISCIREIRDLDSTDHLAVLRVTFEEESLHNIYAVPNQDVAGEMFIIDGQGMVISSSNRGMVAKKTELVDTSALQNSSGHMSLGRSGSKQSLFYTKIDDTGWYLVQILPNTVINSSVKYVNTISVLFVVVFLLFGVFFIAIQNRCVVLPIVSLSREMERVKDGVFEPNIDIPSTNEIGRLTYYFLDMTDRLKNLFETVYKTRLQKREAELRALQEQINPHFLYNSLSSIYWLAYQNKDFEVGRQAEALSNHFRHVLNNGAELTTVGKELYHLENYMLLQRSKVGDRIALHIDSDQKLADCRTVKLILQPLVENAICHGLESKPDGRIDVRVASEGGKIVFTVTDDGVGADQAEIRALLDEAQTEKAFALRNINQRIKLWYGQEYGLEFYSEPGRGTTVTVTIPIENK